MHQIGSFFIIIYRKRPKTMFRKHSPTLTVLLLALCLTWVNSSTMSGSQPKPPAYPPMIPEEDCECCNQITVEGDGIVKAPPNVAIISITLRIRYQDIDNQTALDNMWNDVALISNQLISNINASGVVKVNAFPIVYSQIFNNFFIQQQLTVEVKINKNYLATIQNIIKAVSKTSIITDVYVRINGIQFDRVHDTKILKEAREQAIQDAFQKGELFVCAADGKLGKPQSIKEISTQSKPIIITFRRLFNEEGEEVGDQSEDLQQVLFDRFLIEIKSKVQIKFCVSWPPKPHKPSPKPHPPRPRPK